jgi:hypothetical protein
MRRHSRIEAGAGGMKKRFTTCWLMNRTANVHDSIADAAARADIGGPAGSSNQINRALLT